MAPCIWPPGWGTAATSSRESVWDCLLTGPPGPFDSTPHLPPCQERRRMTWSTKDRNDCKPHHCLLSPGTCCCGCSVAKLCLTLCDPMDYSMPGFPVLHHLPEFPQTHAHWVTDAESFSAVPFFCLQSLPDQGFLWWISSSQVFSSVQSPSLCDPMDCSRPGLPVHHQSFKLGFSSMWTENLQMYKLGLEKAEETGTKLPAFAGS